jgi:hypothetical protein
LFRYEGAQVVNERGKALDIAGAKDRENQNIQVYNRHNKLNQQWDIVYTDEWKGEPGKGELNEDFGLYVDRTFYVISEMKANRYLDVIFPRNMVIKTSNGRLT